MNELTRGECGLLASRSIAAHVVRGAFAAVLLTWAWLHQSSHPAHAVAAVVAAVIAMRGCPTRWTVGLIETIAQLRKQTAREGRGPAPETRCDATGFGPRQLDTRILILVPWKPSS
jgi:hypothetical protein